MAKSPTRRRRREDPAHRAVRKAMDYDALFKKQGGKCAICGRKWKPLNANGSRARRFDRDHNHKTMKPRGLLCHNCNRQLKSRYDADWYLAAHLYLKEYDG